MTDRLIISGLSAGRVGVSYRRGGEDVAQAEGEPVAFAAPLSAEDLADLAWYLERYLLAPYALYAERGAAVEARLKDWGEALFAALFAPGMAARDAYQRAREAEAELVIRSADAAFLALPSELMKDPDRPAPLALDLRGISRSSDVTGPLIDAPQGDALRVLMVISRPSGLDDVDFQMVARPLHERLQAVSGEVRLEVTRPPTLAALDATLQAACAAGAPYHVLHFDGHGVHAGGGGAAGMLDAGGGLAAAICCSRARPATTGTGCRRAISRRWSSAGACRWWCSTPASRGRWAAPMRRSVLR